MVNSKSWGMTVALGAVLIASGAVAAEGDKVNAVVGEQVKSVEAPTARVVAPPVKLAHLPPPVTFTAVSGSLPVLASVTTIVTVSPV